MGAAFDIQIVQVAFPRRPRPVADRQAAVKPFLHGLHPCGEHGRLHGDVRPGGKASALNGLGERGIPVHVELVAVSAVELERLGRGDIRQPAFHRLHGEAVDEIHDDGGLIIALQKLELPNQRVAIGHAAHRLPDLRVKALHPE